MKNWDAEAPGEGEAGLDHVAEVVWTPWGVLAWSSNEVGFERRLKAQM